MSLTDMLGDAQGGLAGLTQNAGGLAELTQSLKNLGLATTDTAGRLRDAQGKFISKDTLQSLAAGGVGAAQAMTQLGKASQDAGAGGATFTTSTKASGNAMQMVTSASVATAAAIRTLGATVVTLATGQVPTATQAGAQLGDMFSGVLTGAASKASEALSKLGPAGAAAGAALEALAGVGGAVVATLLTVSGMVVDVVQKMDLLRDSFAGLAGSAAGGKAIQDTIGKLNLPFAASQVNQWAASLTAAGVNGKKLEEEMKAIASAAALSDVLPGAAAAAESFFKKMGEGGAEADRFTKDLQKGGPKASKILKEMGLNMADIGGEAAAAKMSAEQLTAAVAKAMQKKGGGALADLALTLPNILTKAQEGLRSLFDGLGGKGGPVTLFMQEVQKLFAEFNRGGPAVKQLKPTITTIFGTIFATLTRVTHAVHEMVQGFLGSSKAKGPYAELGQTLRRLTDAASGLASMLGRMGGSGKGSSATLRLLLVVIEMVAGAITTMIDNATMALAIIDALGDVVSNAGNILSGLADEAMNAGKAIIDGLVGGIDIGAFVAKMSALASEGLAAFKAMFGIASPSRVMREHGQEDIAEDGLGEGVERGGAKVKKAMAKLAAPPKKGQGARGEPGDGAGVYIDLRGSTFIGTDEGIIRRMIARVWEEMAGEAGAQPQPLGAT